MKQKVFALLERLVGRFPSPLKELVMILQEFLGSIVKIIGWIFAYETYNLVRSSEIGILIYILDNRFGVWFVLGHYLIFLLYAELFVRFDNKMDFMIARINDQIYYLHLMVSAMEKFVRMHFLWHAENLSEVVFQETKDGSDKISYLQASLFWEFLPTILKTAPSLVIVTIVNPIVGLLCLLGLAFFVFVTVTQSREQSEDIEERHVLNTQGWALADKFVNYFTIAAYAREDEVLDDLKVAKQKVFDKSQSIFQTTTFRYNRAKLRGMEFITQTALLLLSLQVLLYGLPVPILLACWEMISRLESSGFRMARSISLMMEYSATIKAFWRHLKLEPQIANSEAPMAMPSCPLEIELKNVCFHYPSNALLEGDVGFVREQAIRNVSLTIPTGGKIAIVGSSGCGKSTFLKVLNRMVDVTSGEVLLNGVNVRELDLKAVRSLFAFVPQEVEVFSGTIRYNVQFGVDREDRSDFGDERIWECLEFSGLADFVKNKTGGKELNAEIGQRGFKLSGGQKQRLGIARALASLMASGRQVLVLDEATSSQDSITTRALQKTMNSFVKDSGKTVIVVAHNLSTLVGFVDEILVMSEGSIVERGTHDELLQIPCGVYAALWKAHLEGTSLDSD
ncbi:MAG: ABC transporter ATP-binding protein [Patescibacteria group bacterium]